MQQPDTATRFGAAYLCALGALDDRERTIIHYRHRHGETWRAIGERLGVSQERVRQIERRAMRKLRAAIEQGGCRAA